MQKLAISQLQTMFSAEEFAIGSEKPRTREQNFVLPDDEINVELNEDEMTEYLQIFLQTEVSLLLPKKRH